MIIVVILCSFASAIEVGHFEESGKDGSFQLWYVLSDKDGVGMARIVSSMVRMLKFQDLKKVSQILCIFLLMVSILLLLLLACDFERYIKVEQVCVTPQTGR